MSRDRRLMTVIQTDTKTALTDNAYFIHHPERIVHTMAKLDQNPTGSPLWFICTRARRRRHRRVCRMLDEISGTGLAVRLYSGFNPAGRNGRKKLPFKIK